MAEGKENNEKEKGRQDASAEHAKQQDERQKAGVEKGAKATEQNTQSNEVAELKDRLLRLAAEFDNYKKKAASDIQRAKELGKAELIARILPAIDAFEIALYSIGADQKELSKGFGLVFTDLYEALKSEGLQEVGAEGKLDPYKQEVILTRPSEKEEGSVIEIVRKGYMFNSILIRPASVIVSSGKKS
ncbi:MAG: nucleotide exchange factor GrpE [Candidatus Micrarchaeaceae archaeon]